MGLFNKNTTLESYTVRLKVYGHYGLRKYEKIQLAIHVMLDPFYNYKSIVNFVIVH